MNCSFTEEQLWKMLPICEKIQEEMKQACQEEYEKKLQSEAAAIEEAPAITSQDETKEAKEASSDSSDSSDTGPDTDPDTDPDTFSD